MSILATVSCFSYNATDATAIKRTLDDMQQYYTPGSNFSSAFFESLLKCMGKNDDLLIRAQNEGWRKIYELNAGKALKTGKDKWGSNQKHHFIKHTEASFGDGLQIFEPCNYVSNIAYYHSATKLCDYKDWSQDVSSQTIRALKRSLSTLAMGSAFMHGSHTFVGGKFDNNMIAIIAQISYQISVANLPGNSSILRDISDSPRNYTSIEVSDQVTNMMIKNELSEWGAILDNIDVEQKYYITFAGIMVVVNYLIFPFWFVDYPLTAAAHMFLEDEQELNFILGKFLPAAKHAFKDVKVSVWEAFMLWRKQVSLLMRCFDSFIWQEDKFPILDDIIYGYISMNFAAYTMPLWNRVAYAFSNYGETDQYVQHMFQVYPGDKQCRSFSPHALWHEESATVMSEVIFIANYVNKITSRKKK